MTHATPQSFRPEPVRALSDTELDLVTGGPIVIPVAIVYAAKVTGAAVGGAAAGAALVAGTVAVIDGIQSLAAGE